MSPYKMSGTTVVSFSGGRTSAYMLRQVLDNNDDLADLIVTFANTGKEHPATLDFVQECSERWSVPIVWLEYRDDERGFAIVDYQSASRDGQPFEELIRKRSYLPNPVTRFCTIDLKIRVIHKYLRMVGCSTEETPVDMMTGIRADEPRRVAKIRHRKTTSESKHATMVMPLADAGVGVRDVTDFWKAQPFDLMLPTINGRTLEGNCDLCFLKGAKQVYSIIASDRQKAEG
ncbi:Phosphoadenosine phosphosulfate reductase family protein [Pseudomonas graminis]|uniref:Phosphoadenosine phosphosulfate reductase family protein n=1 Tax=Pseudomonas graminis TaxID=158627 RepID=A0A1I0JJI6_9PSED|nr:phosphoadenosine phosphosulfate reductase family protein [Pseudomonas graminis]SEU10246.1 Phosphoadenosine phosphosulfate reductase family protein [Pseudomonas graminis]